MSHIVNHYEFLRNLDEKFFSRIKILYINKYTSLFGNNAFIVTNGGNVYVIGDNLYGCLGLGNNERVLEPKELGDLCGNKVLRFDGSTNQVIALTQNGKIFSCFLKNFTFEKQEIDEFVTDVSCGPKYSFLLTKNGNVFVFGQHHSLNPDEKYPSDEDFEPRKIIGFDGEKVKAISCGFGQSLALTESGRIFKWSNHDYGVSELRIIKDLNVPELIILKDNIIFSKISCGLLHSLLLSDEGDIYSFGNNEERQLGHNVMFDSDILTESLFSNLEGISNVYQREIFKHLKGDYFKTPYKIESSFKFANIFSNINLSVAVTLKGEYYAWGEFEGLIIICPSKLRSKSYKEFLILNGVIGLNNHNFQHNIAQLRECSCNYYHDEFKEICKLSGGKFGTIHKAFHKKSFKLFAIRKVFLCEVSKKKVLEFSEKFVELNSDFVVRYEKFWIETNSPSD